MGFSAKKKYIRTNVYKSAPALLFRFPLKRHVCNKTNKLSTLWLMALLLSSHKFNLEIRGN